MTGGDGSSKQLSLAERRKMALELRKAGLSYRDIAEAIGREYPDARYGKSSAHRDVLAILGETRAEARDLALEVILLDSERLDDLTRVLWEKAMGGDLQVIDRLLAIIRQRVALFGGPGEWLRLLLAGDAQEQPGPEDYAAMSDEALRRLLLGR